MFGTKLKLWMENHIVRPKKKNQHDKEKADQNGVKGLILESSESLAHSDTGISSGSQQVLSSNTDNNEGYCTTTMESSRSGMAHCHTAVNLSSPESAYSTGYSTDGTSPGGMGPPEYYINIRTGKHYFPSPAPTPTSPQPSTAFSQLCSSASHSITTSFLRIAPSSVPSYSSQLPPLLSVQGENERAANNQPSKCFSPAFKLFATKNSVLSTSVPRHFSKSPKKAPKSPLNSLKLFLKSPKQDKVKTKIDEKSLTFQNKKKTNSPVKNRKWYRQPFQKFGHRRTDPSDEAVLKNETVKKEVNFGRSLYFFPKDKTSPRPRNRIRTNPWLLIEPLSSQNFQINFSPNLVRNRSCTNTPLQNRRTEIDKQQSKLAEISLDQTHHNHGHVDKAVHRHIGQKLLLELSDHSEEDLTLNEMMGTYNESYVYEKETDILSDSDPTDCEDYVSDSEADNGGDEQDSHDDELDFIDAGSVVEGEIFLKNTGTCVYYDVCLNKNNFLSKTIRYNSRHESEIRRSFKKDGEVKKKKSKDERRKKSFRKSVRNLERSAERPKIEPLNMSKVLMRRTNGKNGSKSADGTPMCLRRRTVIKELRETPIRSHGAVNAEKCSPFPSLHMEYDLEADRKYKELILEAENIVVALQNSPVIRAKNTLDYPKAEKQSLNIWKEAEKMCSPKYSQVPKKPVANPRKSLDLSLAVDSKILNLGGKSSLKAKSSAHSPLDPLGPTFKNFSIFKGVEKKISSSSSDDFEGNRTERNTETGSRNVVPIAFQSVDLGKPITTYCPQSEPVKRKIYSSSKTYDKLVRRFENETKFVQENEGGTVDRSEPFDVAAFRNNGQGNFFYNSVYPPYSSPNRKSHQHNNNASQCIRQRLSNDVDIIR